MSPPTAVSIPGLTLIGAPQDSQAELSTHKPNPPAEKKGRKSKYATPRQAKRAEAAAKHHAKARSAPSEASGGVPNPTHQYLTQSLRDPVPLPYPRRILIILDLNGTLLYRPSKSHPFHFVERPHARRFIQYCLETFHLAIWSSARPQNVNRMVEKLLTPEQCRRCLLVWARDQFGLSRADYDARVQCYKRLERVWDDPRVAASHPAAAHGGRWDQSNTVLVDDSLEKGRSEPFNILALPEFSGLSNEKAEVLPQVHDYLNELCSQNDVSSYMRKHPFNLDPNYSLPAE